MKAAEHALLATGLVILNKDYIEARRIEFRLVIGFHKIATMVTKNRRLYNRDTFNRRLDKIELTHSST